KRLEVDGNDRVAVARDFLHVLGDDELANLLRRELFAVRVDQPALVVDDRRAFLSLEGFESRAHGLLVAYLVGAADFDSRRDDLGRWRRTFEAWSRRLIRRLGRRLHFPIGCCDRSDTLEVSEPSRGTVQAGGDAAGRPAVEKERHVGDD